MNNLKQAEKAQGEKSAPKKPTNDFQQKIESFNHLQKKVRTRDVLQNHIQSLENLKLPEQKNQFEESPDISQKIILHMGYREEYEIKNPTLINEVKEFMVSKIKTKLSELETEILNTQI